MFSESPVSSVTTHFLNEVQSCFDYLFCESRDSLKRPRYDDAEERTGKVPVIPVTASRALDVVGAGISCVAERMHTKLLPAENELVSHRGQLG